jgi:hypothetical protein
MSEEEIEFIKDRIVELERYQKKGVKEIAFPQDSTFSIKKQKMSKKENIPTHDPQTGELNPYFEELTGLKNPLTKREWYYLRKNLMKGLKTPPSKDKDLDKMPNQKWHQIISFIKSGIRIVEELV